jgi:PilZ domain
MPEKATPVRRFPRFLAEYAVLVRRTGKIGSEKMARTRTIGGGGCMFNFHESLSVGTELDLVLSTPAGVIKAHSKVVWETMAGPYQYEVGIEFLRMTPDDQQVLDATLAALAAARK